MRALHFKQLYFLNSSCGLDDNILLWIPGNCILSLLLNSYIHILLIKMLINLNLLQCQHISGQHIWFKWCMYTLQYLYLYEVLNSFWVKTIKRFSLQDQKRTVKDHSVNVGKRPVSICVCERDRDQEEGMTSLLWLSSGWWKVTMAPCHGLLFYGSVSTFSMCCVCVYLWIHCILKHTVAYIRRTNLLLYVKRHFNLMHLICHTLSPNIIISVLFHSLSPFLVYKQPTSLHLYFNLSFLFVHLLDIHTMYYKRGY